MKNLMNQAVIFSSRINIIVVIRIVILVAFLFAALANPGSVLAEPVMGGSVG